MSAEPETTAWVYACELCPLTFSYPDDLGAHYADAHPTG